MSQPPRRRSRTVSIYVVAGTLAIVALFSFWPRASHVDMGLVVRGPMRVTINEEARTRVRDAYVIPAPRGGHLLRLEVEPGDSVTAGVTVVAKMLPSPPPAIDARTREQARAGVRAAEAGLAVSRADLERAMADQVLAQVAYSRTGALHAAGAVSQTTLDEAERVKRSADAQVDARTATIAMRVADLANARASLADFDGMVTTSTLAQRGTHAMQLTSPISGRVLRVLHRSETTVAAGAPILEVGNVSDDLEIVAELISTDAVQVAEGDRVVIDGWGGNRPLQASVDRIEPFGFTKFSALGVEEQRVNIIMRFENQQAQRHNLGHGYRVEARIVIWSDSSALTVPSSALFRHEGGWAVFTVTDGRAVLTPVVVGRNNGERAQVTKGLVENATVILYPGPELTDRSRVVRRDAEP